MRVLMLSWEYPPVVVGGLGRHVHALARHLAAQGHEVVVLCRQPAGTDASTHPSSDDLVDGVRVIRAAEDPPHVTFERDLFAWTMAMNHAMLRAGHHVLREWRPDVIHAHDWLVTHAAIALAETVDAAMISTIHATEGGRHSGWLSDPLNQQIHSVEWWLTHRSECVITCSEAMRAEITTLFDLDTAKISVLHNGIERQRDGSSHDPRQREITDIRSKYAQDGGPLLLYAGRLEWEKGIQDLIAGMRAIRRRFPHTTAVIAGTGTQTDWLIEQARKHRVRRALHFPGRIEDSELDALFAAADSVVLPSRYEPFGIVALEAAAAATPLVCSTAGGLGEIVTHQRTGLSFPPGNVDALVSAVCAVLAEPGAAAQRASAARARLDAEFDWDHIASATAEVYQRARAEASSSCRRVLTTLHRPKIPTGNVF